MRKILFVMPALYGGGAEKSLVNLLNLIDYKKYAVDLLLFKQEGLFLTQIPKEVRLLPLTSSLRYAYKIDMGMFGSLSGFKTGMLRLMSTVVCKVLYKEKAGQQRWMKCYKYCLPNLEGKYDIAVGFLEGEASYYVIDKVNAKRKILWVHSNFENIKKNDDAAAYKEYFCKADRVVSISDKCVQVLQNNYPDMKNKFVLLPNLTSSIVLSNTAKADIDEVFSKDDFNIVSVGRLTEAKGFDMAIDALKILKDHKVPVHWWIIGDGELRKCLEKQAKDNSVEEYLTFLGFKANPYPYMNKADLIVQTSRWEGKSVVLDEAKILGKPILATDYATVKDQVENGKEGVIVKMDAESIAREIEHLVEDESVLNGIRNYLMARNYGNQSEIVKYYKLFDQ